MTSTSETAGEIPGRNGPGGELPRSLGLFDSTMLVAGSMIGSGIFIVSAEMARQLGSPGWLLASWIVTGVLTLTAALSYGELAAMMPRAGGQYVYLRESFSPMWGFLYGWTLFLVIQTGTIAAVGIGFARYLGTLWPAVSESNYIVAPIHVSSGYAVSLSTAQLTGILVISFLTWTNSRGVKYGRRVQNFFTCAKLGSLLGLIGLALLIGWNSEAVRSNFTHPWALRDFTAVVPGLSPGSAFGLLVALCVAQTGSLFAADAWNNITFTAGEVRNPRRNVPLSLALGTGIVIGLYLLANVAYLVVLPFTQIQHAASDRVAGATLQAIFPTAGAKIMAIAIMISGFGCINGMILSGARAYFAMARDGLFFARAAAINKARVPGAALLMQAVWTILLVLVRTYKPATATFGNLFSDLLDYVISAALMFYILTIAGVFVLRRSQPNAERPYRAVGYPFVPAMYILGASVILIMLFIYRPSTTLPGVVIVLLGVPAYLWFKRRLAPARRPRSIHK
ncbi:MAG: amino acid permease [Acidobacteriota bacterium]|nr:amino acid permease [Acidobacteriota bacterium]